MGPDWYFNAYEACEELYEGEWDSMSDAQRDEKVSDYVFASADAQEADE